MNPNPTPLPPRPTNLFLRLHLLVCTIGLFAVMNATSAAIFESTFSKPPLLAFNEWAQSWFFFLKPITVIFYCLSVAGVSLYLTLGAFLTKASVNVSSRFRNFLIAHKYRPFIYFFALFALNWGLFIFQTEYLNPRDVAHLDTAVWLAAILFPFYPSLFGPHSRLSRFLSNKKAALFVLSVMLIQMVLLFLPFMNGNPFILNEYMDIPEYTLVGDHYVKNAGYINEHQITGCRMYDPDLDKGIMPTPINGTELPFKTLESASPVLLSYFQYGTHDLFPDYKRDGLVCYDSIPERDRKLLLQMAYHDKQKTAISQFLNACSQTQNRLRNKVFTADEMHFYEDNLYELKLQFGGGSLHHNNFLLAPILEYSLGRPSEQIGPQYGWFNMILIKTMLNHAGGINFQNYFRVMYAFYPLYYLLFVALLGLLFRRLDYVLMSTALIFGSVFFLGFENINTSLGFDPLRHFLDITVAGCVFLYVKKKSWAPFLLSLLLALLSLFINNEFGVLILLSLLFTYGMHFAVCYNRVPWGRLAWLGLTILAAVILGRQIPSYNNSLALYYVMGIGSLPIHPQIFAALMLSVSLLYCFFLRFIKSRDPLAFVGLFLFAYSQGLFVYYVWNPAPNHFISFAPIVLLLLVIVLKFSLESHLLKRYEPLCLRAGLLAAVLLFYIPMYCENGIEIHDYRHVFETHRVFQWDLKMAKFRSTMDPRYFTEAVDLIKRYAPNDNGIYILSKYDNFIPFLAEKFSAMPFIELSQFLLTPREVALSVQAIQKARPEYLFVDTDIDRNLSLEIISDRYPMSMNKHDESASRALRLKELQNVFEVVRNDYEPVDVGLLITVYKRKPNPSPEHQTGFLGA